MYAFRTISGPPGADVDLAFTDRLGGVSAAPYDTLNLAVSGADVATDRARNLQLLMADFAPGDRLAELDQVHGSDVVDADRVVLEPPTRTRGDGLVSATSGTVLMVRVADCVPVLLADPQVGVIGAAHCGRPGLAAGVVPAVVTRMRELGAGTITAWVGPHVCGGCYEVPLALQEEVAALVPQSRATTRWGTPALDLGAGVRAQLEEFEVQVREVGRCTRESADLFSYRRDGAAAGRQVGMIRMRS